MRAINSEFVGFPLVFAAVIKYNELVKKYDIIDILFACAPVYLNLFHKRPPECSLVVIVQGFVNGFPTGRQSFFYLGKVLWFLFNGVFCLCNFCNYLIVLPIVFLDVFNSALLPGIVQPIQLSLQVLYIVLADLFSVLKYLDVFEFLLLYYFFDSVNPYFKPTLELFMKQQNKCDAILFNNGLHGWHLSPEAYEAYYEQMLRFLLQTGKPVYG